MTDQDSRRELVEHWWSKAAACMESARRELDAGSLDFVANRLYYAAFYAATAAMLARGLSFRKHSGLRSAFHTHLVRPGLVSQTGGKLYDRLFEDRQEGDYIAFSLFDRDYLEEQLLCTQALLEELRLPQTSPGPD